MPQHPVLPAAFYHITTDHSVDVIMRTGLIPQQGPRSNSADERRPATYCFPTIDNALDAGASWLGECFVEEDELILLHIAPQNLTFYPTFNAADSWEWITYDHIPANRLTIVQRNF